MNFILSIVIITIYIYSYGLKDIKNIPIIDSVSDREMVTIDESGEIVKVISPANQLDLQPGDEILTVNGIEINTWADLTNQINNRPNQLIHLEWLTDYDDKGNGIAKQDSVQLYASPDLEGIKIKKVGLLGISPEFNTIELNLFQSVVGGISRTYQIIEDVSYSFIGLVSGNIPIKYSMGLIGMANEAGETAKNDGFISLILLMAFISTNLGFINILPIPGLDGGHAAITIIEGVRGKDLSSQTKMKIQFIGICIIMMLFAYTIFNDLRNANIF